MLPPVMLPLALIETALTAATAIILPTVTLPVTLSGDTTLPLKLKLTAFNVLALGAVNTEMLHEAFPGYEASIWWAWAATGGTPTPIINKINAEVAEVLKRPDIIKRFTAEGAEVEARSPADIREMIRTDLAKWEKVAQDAKMVKQ